MRRPLVAGVVLGVVAALGLAAPSQAAPQHRSSTPATVGVFHAVPNVPVDVYVGKQRVVDDFQPGTFAGPLKLKAGTYTVRITKATATSWKHPIIGPATLRVKSGGNYSVIAHLNAKDKPVITTYTNDLSPVKSGKGRVTVRHVAAAPKVDVLVDGAAAITRLKNPHEAKAQLKVGTYEVAVALSGTTHPVLGPTHLAVTANTNTIVYAWGSAKQGDLALAVRTLPTKQHHHHS